MILAIDERQVEIVAEVIVVRDGSAVEVDAVAPEELQIGPQQEAEADPALGMLTEIYEGEHIALDFDLAVDVSATDGVLVEFFAEHLVGVEDDAKGRFARRSQAQGFALGKGKLARDGDIGESGVE